MGRIKDLGGRFWSHCTGPVTVRSIVFVAVMILFLWALFDRLAARDHNKAMQHRLELISAETQRGLTQIYQSWAKFDEGQKQVLINQRAMQDEIAAQTAILKTERLIREKELDRVEAKEQPRPRSTRPRRRPPARPPRSRACFRLEDQITKFGEGAEVKRQILVSVPCP